MDETHEPPSSEIGGVEEVVHEYDQNSLPSDSEKYDIEMSMNFL